MDSIFEANLNSLMYVGNDANNNPSETDCSKKGFVGWIQFDLNEELQPHSQEGPHHVRKRVDSLHGDGKTKLISL